MPGWAVLQSLPSIPSELTLARVTTNPARDDLGPALPTPAPAATATSVAATVPMVRGRRMSRRSSARRTGLSIGSNYHGTDGVSGGVLRRGRDPGAPPPLVPGALHHDPEARGLRRHSRRPARGAARGGGAIHPGRPGGGGLVGVRRNVEGVLARHLHVAAGQARHRDDRADRGNPGPGV